MKSNIIVSLTSYGIRLSKVHEVIYSILSGVLLPDKIVITIYKGDEHLITDELKKMCSDNDLEIIICDDDLRPHKKYYYTMCKYRNNPIVTIDDDVIYPPTFLSELYSAYKNFNCIISRRSRKISRDDSGNLLPYKMWPLFCGESVPSFDYLPTGIGGVLYPPNALHISEGIMHLIKDNLTTDDILLYSLAVKNNIKIKNIKASQMYKEIKDKEIFDIGLWRNENIENNDISIKKLIK